jgi:sec-independent protein translocase protein TatA
MFRGLFQPMHLLIILVIVLIIFGPGRLPEIGKGLGESIRGFKKAISGDENDDVQETPKEITSPKTAEMKQEAAQEETAEQKNKPMV